MTTQWQERVTPTLFKFETKGQPITGRLVAANMVDVKGKLVLQYIIENEAGDRRIKLLATYDLAEKLGKTDVGRLVRITWVGENAEAGTAENAMKLYKVEIAKEEEEAA